MAEKFQKLELTWIGKGEEPKLEPRILLENPDYSYSPNLRVLRGEKILNREGREEHEGKRGGTDNSNMLIHGDNLLALKALEQDYTGKIKCIAIDPPYNTGNAFEHYDDGVEHSIWLNLMSARLKILKNLLTYDGMIWIILDDNEVHYCKLLCDEIFGRDNFLNQVSIKMKQTAGASGGGEDKRLKKNIEYILVYAKNKDGDSGFKKFNDVYDEKDLFEVIEDMRINGKSWKYTRVLKSLGTKIFFKTIEDGSGEPIQIYKHENVIMEPISSIMQGEKLTEVECYIKYFEKIFRDTNAQSSIRTRVMDATNNKQQDDFFSIEYYPKSGRNKGQMTTLYYKGNNCDLIAWLSDIVVKKGTRLLKLEKAGTYWEGFPLNNLTKEGDVLFPKGKKPEVLIQKILNLSTQPNDIVLDSFLGSGTTAAVAHKMGRRWIGIEFGDHAVTHCLPRLRKVIDGTDQGGISKEVGWTGGGGFKFYTLAPKKFRTCYSANVNLAKKEDDDGNKLF
jgi:adenine-specific DNA-methyltransferase